MNIAENAVYPVIFYTTSDCTGDASVWPNDLGNVPALVFPDPSHWDITTGEGHVFSANLNPVLEGSGVTLNSYRYTRRTSYSDLYTVGEAAPTPRDRLILLERFAYTPDRSATRTPLRIVKKEQ